MALMLDYTFFENQFFESLRNKRSSSRSMPSIGTAKTKNAVTYTKDYLYDDTSLFFEKFDNVEGRIADQNLFIFRLAVVSSIQQKYFYVSKSSLITARKFFWYNLPNRSDV